MSFDSMLIHVCSAYRRAGTVDRYGQATEAVMSGAPHASFPCRVSTPQGGKVTSERNQEMFEDLYTVFIRPNADVREDDLVHITDQAGHTLINIGRIHQRNEFRGAGYTEHHSELSVFEQEGPVDGPEVP